MPGVTREASYADPPRQPAARNLPGTTVFAANWGNKIGGEMTGEFRGTGILDFMANAAHVRADHYRQQASQLRRMAEGESLGRMRDGLLPLADQYDGLVAITLRGLGQS